jgi:lysophospholipase L1-like esterase
MPPSLDLRSLTTDQAGRLFILAILAILLLAVDALPDGIVGDRDRLQFLLSLAIGLTALTLSLVDRLTRAQWTALRNRMILMAVTLGISAVGAEYATRFVFRDVTTTTDNASYFTRRWLRTGPSRLNAQGFRGPSFTDAKPPGIYRVAVVGDSFTFGNGVRQEDRYTDLVQARLPPSIEVLNFGVPGDNTPEHEKSVAKLVRTIQPDFVLLQWYVNDMEDDDMTGRPSFRPLVPPLHSWLDARSALYSVANKKWGETQVRLGWTKSYVEFVNGRLQDPQSRHSQEDKQFLQTLIDHCKKAGVQIGMVLFPETSAPITDTYPFGYLHDRVLAMCADNGMTCIDLRQDFAMVKDHRQLWASRFDHHPSARANAIAAERILGTFAAKWASSPSR